MEGVQLMKPLRVMIGAALAFCLVTAFPAAAETEKVHKVVPIGPGGTLELHNFSGAVRITGANVNEVTIDAVRKATRERLDRITLDIQSDGRSVRIEANKKDSSRSSDKDNVVETEFDIQVPRDARLKLDVFSSSVRVRNVAGEQSIHGFSGEMVVEDAGAAIVAKTFSGPLSVHLAQAEVTPDLDLETFSGDIDIRVPDAARAAVSFDSFSGSLTTDLPLTFQEKKRGSLKATLNGGDTQHAIRLKTFSGDAKIGR
jgi:hypothetical protein